MKPDVVEPPNMEGLPVAIDLPKIDVPEDDEEIPPDCPVVDVPPVLLVAVEVPKIDIPEDDDEVPPVVVIGVPKIDVFPVLLAAVGFPKIDVPEEDDVVPPDCPKAAVVAVVEPNTDLLGADKAVKGDGPPEELPESAVVLAEPDCPKDPEN